MEKEGKKGGENLKTKMFIKNSECTYVYIANRDKDCDLLHDRPILLTGRMPHNKQNCNCSDYNQNLFMSSGGAQCQWTG